ncbi:huntingtin-interacting protein 1-like isoform X2 [Euwallacea similis]|uniref:huntingtin-interacting protein 1-like isoform X2 n=1 Tax=Euwallacea similis TaxID=1736056 RepID=UPI00344B9496
MIKDYTNKDYSKYVESLEKAVNDIEAPIKTKHVRILIIGTFHAQNAEIFWNSACRLSITDNHIVAWKFCYVLHKILREGHPLSLLNSQPHRKDLSQIGTLSMHFPDDYGKIIALYISLLIYKLEFHEINTKFPGHLGLSPEEFVSIGGENVDNNYFNLTIDMFDYIDHILALQEAVFGSLNASNSNSMTSAGQCKLFPLMVCIEDALKLYDYCVKMLLKMHITLTHNVLTGHRARFSKQFGALKRFYERVSNLQYFNDLIIVPSLPDHPPVFTSLTKSPFYISQGKLVTQKPNERKTEPIKVTNLNIDDNRRVKHINNHYEAARFVCKDANDGMVHLSVLDYQYIIQEKEFFRKECERLKGEINSLVSRNIQETSLLQYKIASLEHLLRNQ